MKTCGFRFRCGIEELCLNIIAIYISTDLAMARRQKIRPGSRAMGASLALAAHRISKCHLCGIMAIIIMWVGSCLYYNGHKYISYPQYGGAWQVSHEQNVPPWFWLSIRRWNIGFCFGLFRMFLFFRLCKVLINSPLLCSVHLFSYSRPARSVEQQSLS